MIIVFDLDGTLIDSARDISESVSEMIQSYGAPPVALSEVVNMVGDGAPTLVSRALKNAGLDPSPDEALTR